jgi:hypothetical protein
MKLLRISPLLPAELMQLLNSKARKAAEMLQQLQHHVECIHQISETLDLGDPFSYNRMREIQMANALGHTIATAYAGKDATDENGEGVEYKSTTQKRMSATYNGISNYNDWGEQWDYILNDKIGCYEWHYLARFDGPNIVEMWKMHRDDVLRCLEPKLYKSWQGQFGSRKDKRIGASLSAGQIKKYGTKVT